MTYIVPKSKRDQPAIKPFEALDGYIARVAAARYLDAALEITGLVGVRYGNRPDVTTKRWHALPRLAAILDVDVGELRLRSYPPIDPKGLGVSFFGTSILRADLELRSRRFAPGGLAISPHIRAISQVRAFPFCEESWQLLTSQCHRCRTIQRWHHTNGVDRCDHCLANLATGQSEAVPEEHQSALSDAIGLIHPDPARRRRSLDLLPDVLRAAGSSAAFELLVRLLPVIDNELARQRHLIAVKPDALRLVHAVAAAWRLMEGWPHAFDHMVAELAASRDARGGDGNRNATMAFLRTQTTARAPIPVPQAVRAALAWCDMPDADHPPAGTMGLLETARALSVGTQTIVAIRRAGGFRPRIGLTGKKVSPLFERAEVEMLVPLINGRIPMNTAAADLGISIHGVEQLAATSLLDLLTHPYFMLRYHAQQITERSFHRLLGRFNDAAVPTTPEYSLRLIDAVKVIGGRLKPWAPIFALLLIDPDVPSAGRIPFALAGGDEPLCERVLLRPADAMALLHLRFDRDVHPGFPFNDHMTKRDAGEALNLTAKAYGPFFVGLARPDRPTGLSMSVEIVERIARQNLSFAELAAISGTPAQTLYWMAVHANIAVTAAGIPAGAGNRMDAYLHAQIAHRLPGPKSDTGASTELAASGVRPGPEG